MGRDDGIAAILRDVIRPRIAMSRPRPTTAGHPDPISSIPAAR
jgi:hypothetical protein